MNDFTYKPGLALLAGLTIALAAGCDSTVVGSGGSGGNGAGGHGGSTQTSNPSGGCMASGTSGSLHSFCFPRDQVSTSEAVSAVSGQAVAVSSSDSGTSGTGPSPSTDASSSVDASSSTGIDSSSSVDVASSSTGFMSSSSNDASSSTGGGGFCPVTNAVKSAIMNQDGHVASIADGLVNGDMCCYQTINQICF